MIPEERWLPVVGYEGLYEVSDRGRVKSLSRVRGGKSENSRPRQYPEKLLRCGENTHGYPTVGLYSASGKVKMRTVHILVIEAFVGPRPIGMEALHADDVKTNNNLSNLRWGTPAENSADAVRNGVHNKTRRVRCGHGHEYTEQNTRWAEHSPGRFSRQCRACGREWQSQWRKRQQDSTVSTTAGGQ